jgi:hypothetical protein
MTANSDDPIDMAGVRKGTIILTPAFGIPSPRHGGSCDKFGEGRGVQADIYIYCNICAIIFFVRECHGFFISTLGFN